ncbi:hypothetical protein [Mycobacterium colombiense]|uniref:hypothetical protein n=1 Tax=Mycobacterium colombiense TaxID=339268 RepID=UPI0018C899C6|nr:hypothetical protein [Mycobacterium colombiense]
MAHREVLARQRGEDLPQHVSPADRKAFANKDDTWQRGVKELEKLGLASSETGRSTTNRRSSDLRTHKIYYLNTSHLGDNDSPAEPVELS